VPVNRTVAFMRLPPRSNDHVSADAIGDVKGQLSQNLAIFPVFGLVSRARALFRLQG